MTTNKKPKLYQYSVCPFCCKVKAFLSYKKIPHEIVEVHPLNKKEIKFSKKYKKVPIFVDVDGNQINDSTPIMRYLEENFDGVSVFEKKGEAKANEESWLKWADEILVRALPPLIYRNLPDAIKAFDYITKEGKFSWIQQQTIKYSGAMVMTIVAKKSAKSQGITDPKLHLEKCLEDWSRVLGNQEFFGKNKPNAADLAVYGILKSIEGMPAFRIIQNHNIVYEWYQRMEGTALVAA